ncbi:MAG: 50S ribosomal protein L4 [Promethearchaeota archaeon]|nr:MAG: 50S ribosomal protein L4 [Candidatus Lokiarchaeota archaeon]
MEKINIYGLDGKTKGLIDKPEVFSFNPRKDLIQKAAQINQSKKKQAQGRDKRAGLRNTAEGWGTGHGISRAPRLKGSGYPTARNVGRVPFAIGGRRAHPIKIEKKVKKRINKKTYKLSLISAIAASGNLDWVRDRGYLIEAVPEIPLVIDDKVQSIKNTEKIYRILFDLGLKNEILKLKKSKKIRSGKGKRRGRKYKKSRGVLIVIKDNFGIIKACRNIPGIDITKIDNLSIDDLAPGGKPGRLIIWTQSAFNELNKKYEDLL